MRSIFFLVVGLIISISAYSQGIIKGQVIDSVTQESIPYTKILVDEANVMRSTDLEGYFAIEVPEGTYNVKVSFGTGYIDKVLTATVRNGETVNLGQIALTSDVIGLKELEVISDNIDAQSQLPTPVTTITAEEFENKMGAQEFPEMMKSTPGVYVSTVGGSFGDASVRIRGFGSENTAVLINGMPVNDMETGRVFWSNWGGMNDVTRNQQIQRGLGASRLAISSVGGTINIITKPTEFRKGVKISYARSNRSYQNRTMVTMSTGQMKGGWAVTALGSKRDGAGFREGTYANAYAYFLTVSKEVNDKHLFMFTGFGAPQESGRGWSVTQRSYEIMENYNSDKYTSRVYNPTWGYQNGEVRNAARSKYHKPVFMLNHNWYISDKTTLANVVYYSFGRGGGTNFNRVNGTDRPIPFNLQEGASDSTYQVQWDAMILENQNNPDTIGNPNGLGVDANPQTGNRSKYIWHESRNDHDWLGGISTLNHKLSENTELTFGLDYRWYRGYHYQVLEDLLGGDYWVDRDRFSLADNNALSPNRIARVGDTIGYNYNGTVQTMGTFAQVKHTLFNKLDLFGTATVSNTQMYRTGYFLNGNFIDDELSNLGKSEIKAFTNYSVKAGANYRINGRHNVYVNSGQFTRAPFFRNAFIDNRVSNQYRDNLKSEEIFSLEAGYGFRSPKVAANLNFYRTSWKNRSYVANFQSNAYDGDFVTFVMNNVGALHQGVELDAKASIVHNLELRGQISIGDWRWDGDAEAIVLTNPGLQPLDNPESGLPTTEDNQTIYIDGLKVGGSAQTTAALGFHYKGKGYWYAGGDVNYYGYMYADYNPEEKTDEEAFFNQVKRLDGKDAGDKFIEQYPMTLDLYGGKSWKVKDVFIQLKFNVNNVLNNQFITDSRQQVAALNDPDPSPIVQYYFGRTFFAGLTVSF